MLTVVHFLIMNSKWKLLETKNFRWYFIINWFLQPAIGYIEKYFWVVLPVPKLDDLLACTEDVSDSHRCLYCTSLLILHVVYMGWLRPVPWLNIYSGSLLLSFLCLLQASIIKLFLCCWGIKFFLIFLLEYETKIKFYVGVWNFPQKYIKFFHPSLQHF